MIICNYLQIGIKAIIIAVYNKIKIFLLKIKINIDIIK